MSSVFKLYISSVVVAFFTVIPALNMILTRTSSGDAVFMERLYFIALFMVTISLLLQRGKKILPYNQWWIVLFSIIVVFMFTKFSGAPSTIEPVFFAMFTLVPLIIPQLVDVDVKTMLRAMMVIPSFGILSVSQIFDWQFEENVTMELTYAFLTPIISALVYGFTYYKEDNKWGKLLWGVIIAINLVYFIYCLLFGSRGPSLSVILCVLFLICTRISVEKRGYKIKPIFWFWLIVVILFAIFFDDFMRGAIRIADAIGIEASSFERALDLYQMGNLDDGRSRIVSRAIPGIMNSPLFGYGISSSLKITGYDYPHNFILQLLLDGGILLFLAVMIPMLSRLRRDYNYASYDEHILICALFFSSIPGALFSLDLWMNQRVWLFMGFLLSRRFALKNC